MEALTTVRLDLLLIETLIRGTILLLLASGVTLALKRSPAALRHTVWSTVFIALLLLPVFSVLLPELKVTLPAGEAAPAVIPEAKTATEAFAAIPQVVEHTVRTAVRRAAPVITAPANTGTTAAKTGLMPMLLMAWGLGVVVMLMVLAITLFRLFRVARGATPVHDRDWQEALEIACARLSIVRPVRIMTSSEVAVPMTYGIRHPVVLLPEDAAIWAEDRREVVLLHELIHVIRHDFLTHLIAQLARAVYWFNPLSWYAVRRLFAERERACDDGVLSFGVVSTHYADHLLNMAKSILTGREVPTAALAMARPSELRSRINAILDPSPRTARLSRLQQLAGAGLMLFLVLPLAAVRPVTGATAQQVPDVDVKVSVEVPDVTRLMESVDEAVAESVNATADAVASVDVEVPDTDFDFDFDFDVDFDASELNFDFGTMDLFASRDTTKDAAHETRKRAVFALSQLPRAQALPRLEEIARTHPDAEIRADAIFWIGQVGGSDAAELLEEYARNDKDVQLQKRAIFGLGQLPDHAGVPALIDLARNHRDASVRSDAVFWLGQSGDPRAVDVLMEIANGK